jgi:outer membrane protein assembly factor BamA
MLFKAACFMTQSVNKPLSVFIRFTIVFIAVLKSSVALGYLDSVYVYIIHSIKIEGNKKTRAAIIQRELGFSQGDSITSEDLPLVVKKAQRQLINTSLFLEASVTAQFLSPVHIEVEVKVKERWYVFPVPVFSLADNNFNVWWRQQMRSLKRVNIGLALSCLNVTGHNDELSFGFQTGFSNGFGLNYDRPNIGANKRHGIGIQSFMRSTREVIYGSAYNRKSVIRQDDIIVRNKELKIYYTYRKKINTQHTLSLRLSNMKIADTVASLNPQYLGLGRNNITYMEAGYKFKHIHADNWQYPLKGYTITAEITKTGLGKWNDINMVRINTSGGRFISLGKKWYADFGFKGNYAFSDNLPFIKQQAFGYDDEKILRGLDLYVLDGQAYLLTKNNIKRKIADTHIQLKFLPSQFEKIPIRVFLKAFGDAGYVFSKMPKSDQLVNRWLFTGGLGADLVTYYDTAIAFEYGWNQLGQSGFFIRMNFGL